MPSSSATAKGITATITWIREPLATNVSQHGGSRVPAGAARPAAARARYDRLADYPRSCLWEELEVPYSYVPALRPSAIIGRGHPLNRDCRGDLSFRSLHPLQFFNQSWLHFFKMSNSTPYRPC